MFSAANDPRRFSSKNLSFIFKKFKTTVYAIRYNSMLEAKHSFNDQRGNDFGCSRYYAIDLDPVATVISVEGSATNARYILIGQEHTSFSLFSSSLSSPILPPLVSLSFRCDSLRAMLKTSCFH